MSRWPLPDRLNLLLVAVLLFTAWGPVCFEIFRADCDTMQFYVAGELVNRGEAHRLYDQPYFYATQRQLGGSSVSPTEYSSHLYPPTVALLASPWARLPYGAARVTWWIGQALLYCGAGWMACRGASIAPRWRVTAALALATIFPFWIAVRIGQLTALWLVALFAGILLHRRGNLTASGVVLSVLALKPQLAVPVFIWLLLRRDRRPIGGMAIGVAAQAIAVIVCLGPSMPGYYLSELPNLAKAAKALCFSPAFEQSFAGTLQGILVKGGWLSPQLGWAAMLAQPILSLLSGILLLQAVLANQRLERRGEAPRFAAWYEYSCAVLFLLLFTPHLLLYDMGLLAVPMVCLWSSPGWRMGVVLYLSTTVAAALLYLGLDFSPAPLLMFWILYRLSRQLHELTSAAIEATCAKRPSPGMAAAGCLQH